MNKLMGFYELKTVGIPTIKWGEFSYDTELSGEILWTVRTAKIRGNDFNLPRFIGVTADKAVEEGRRLKEKLKDDGMVIYYPYFVADKSGTLKVSLDKTVIEAVDKDLWNLVTYGRRNVTMIVGEDGIEISGDDKFLDKKEADEILKYAKLLHGKYLHEYLQDGELYLEWSYAYNSSIDGKPIGKRYLLFYEMRVV